MAVVVCSVLAAPLWAQGTTWIQIEARPNEAQALERAGAYAAGLPDVSGFRLNSGWYAITLGPYSEDEARARLAALRRAGAIPGDSYLTEGETFADMSLDPHLFATLIHKG